MHAVLIAVALAIVAVPTVAVMGARTAAAWTPNRNEPTTPEIRAAFLAHAYTFVTMHCPAWKIDEKVFRATLAEDGLRFEDLRRPDIAEKIAGMDDYFSDVIAADKNRHCERLVKNLGPFAPSTPGVIVAR